MCRLSTEHITFVAFYSNNLLFDMVCVINIQRTTSSQRVLTLGKAFELFNC